MKDDDISVIAKRVLKTFISGEKPITTENVTHAAKTVAFHALSQYAQQYAQKHLHPFLEEKSKI